MERVATWLILPVVICLSLNPLRASQRCRIKRRLVGRRGEFPCAWQHRQIAWTSRSSRQYRSPPERAVGTTAQAVGMVTTCRTGTMGSQVLRVRRRLRMQFTD